jgi:hypothetical protein
MTRRKVFFVSKCRFDVASAEKHGEIVFLYDDNRRLPSGIFNPKECMADMARTLGDLDFDPDLDCIAVTGNIALCVMLFMVASELHPIGQVKALIYDARHNDYKLRLLDPKYCEDEVSQ